MMVEIIVDIILCIMIPLWIMGAICWLSDGHIFGRLFHRFLGWHFPDDSQQTFDGVNIHARCRFCGERIMQDSQGNWFAAYYEPKGGEEE